jgi:hypothetical protein
MLVRYTGPAKGWDYRQASYLCQGRSPSSLEQSYYIKLSLEEEAGTIVTIVRCLEFTTTQTLLGGAVVVKHVERHGLGLRLGL